MHKTTDSETAKRQSNYRGPECQQLGDVSRYMNTQMHAYLLVWPQRSVPRALSWHRSLWTQNNRRPALWSDCSCNNPPWRSALKTCSVRFCRASMRWFMIQIIIKAQAAVSPSFPLKVHRCFVFLQRTAWTVAALNRAWFAEIWIAVIIR